MAMSMSSMQYYTGKCSHCEKERPEVVIELYKPGSSGTPRVEYRCTPCYNE
jgi:hypothetical protein